jgi:hypothetical protein
MSHKAQERSVSIHKEEPFVARGAWQEPGMARKLCDACLTFLQLCEIFAALPAAMALPTLFIVRAKSDRPGIG